MNLFLENVYKMLETRFPDFQKLYWQWLRNGEGRGRLAFTHWGIAPWKGGYFRRFGSLPFYFRSMTFPIAHPNEQKTMI